MASPLYGLRDRQARAVDPVLGLCFKKIAVRFLSSDDFPEEANQAAAADWPALPLARRTGSDARSAHRPAATCPGAMIIPVTRGQPTSLTLRLSVAWPGEIRPGTRRPRL